MYKTEYWENCPVSRYKWHHTVGEEFTPNKEKETKIDGKVAVQPIQCKCKYMKSLHIPICSDVKYDQTQRFDRLRSFSISRCNMTHLPDFMKNCKQLKILVLGNCVFQEVPEVLRHCTSLVNVRMYGWKNLKSLPDFIFRLPKLHELDISGCSALEADEKQWLRLARYSSIRTLDVRRTPLERHLHLFAFLPKIKTMRTNHKHLDLITREDGKQILKQRSKTGIASVGGGVCQFRFIGDALQEARKTAIHKLKSTAVALQSSSKMRKGTVGKRLLREIYTSLVRFEVHAHFVVSNKVNIEFVNILSMQQDKQLNWWSYCDLTRMAKTEAEYDVKQSLRRTGIKVSHPNRLIESSSYFWDHLTKTQPEKILLDAAAAASEDEKYCSGGGEIKMYVDDLGDSSNLKIEKIIDTCRKCILNNRIKQKVTLYISMKYKKIYDDEYVKRINNNNNIPELL